MQKFCRLGHEKTPSPKGELRCQPCNLEKSRQRAIKAREAIGRTKYEPRSVEVDELCIRGHKKHRMPYGVVTCCTCKKLAKNARRHFASAGGCPHAEEPGFDHIMSNTWQVVCLACLAQQYVRVA